MRARGADRRPDRLQGAGEAAELGLVRDVVQHLGAGQVQQPQLGRHHAAQDQQRQRVELHLEQRPRLGDRPGRAAGLVVDHPDRGAVRPRAVDPIDVPAQQQPRLQLDLDEQLPGLRFEQARVLEGEVGVEQPPGARQPGLGVGGRHRGRCCPPASTVARAVPRRRHPRACRRRRSPVPTSRRRTARPGARVVGTQPRPRRAEERPRGLRRALLGRQQEQPLQHRVHQRAADLGRGRHLGQPVDRPEPVQQRALLEVVRARRRERGAPRDVARLPGRGEPLRPGGALRLRHAGHGRAGVRQFP